MVSLQSYSLKKVFFFFFGFLCPVCSASYTNLYSYTNLHAQIHRTVHQKLFKVKFAVY